METSNRLIVHTLIFARVAVFVILATLVLVQRAHADQTRSQRRLGAYVGFGEPYPAPLGLNVGYNALSFMRASLGWGRMELAPDESSQSRSDTPRATAWGIGSKAFFPDWEASPTVGLSASYLRFEGHQALIVQGLRQTGVNVYASLGMDWQSRDGWQIAAGTTLPFTEGAVGGFYASAGWFIDVL